MSIGGRFQPVRALILGSFRQSGKGRVFGGLLNDDPVTKVHLFLLQIIHGTMACAAMSRLSDGPFSVTRYRKARMRLSLIFYGILLRQDCWMVLDSLTNTHEGLNMSATPMLLFFSGFVITANE